MNIAIKQSGVNALNTPYAEKAMLAKMPRLIVDLFTNTRQNENDCMIRTTSPPHRPLAQFGEPCCSPSVNCPGRGRPFSHPAINNLVNPLPFGQMP
jgi:hypothetical protein